MTTARYKFTRRDNNINAFLSNSTPSTDAIKAVNEWSRSRPKRSYTILIDKDDHIIVELNFEKSDVSAGADMDDACHKFGVDRVYSQA